VNDALWQSTEVTGGDMPRIECPCGFKVSGFDEARNQWALEEHQCSLNPPEQKRWYQYAFSGARMRERMGAKTRGHAVAIAYETGILKATRP
jgi:hypothetical protein